MAQLVKSLLGKHKVQSLEPVKKLGMVVCTNNASGKKVETADLWSSSSSQPTSSRSGQVKDLFKKSKVGCA